MAAKLMLKNLRSFITGTPLAFLVIILIEIFGTIGIVLTYGIVRNVYTEQEQESFESRRMIYERYREGEGYTSWDNSDLVIDTFDNVGLRRYRDKMASASLEGILSLNDTEYSAVCSFYRSASDYSIEGVSYDKFANGGNVVIVCDELYPCKAGDTIIISGIDYKVIGTRSNMVQAVAFIFPYNNAPDGIRFTTMELLFKDIPTKEMSNEIKTILEEQLGTDYPIREPDIPDLLIKQFNAVMLIGCTIAMILIISNCITVYMYILRKRKNWLTVVKLCGCKNRKLIEIFLSEMLLVSCICFGVGYVISAQIIIPKMSRFYPAFETVYVPKAYIGLFAGFIIISLLISYIRLLFFVNKPIDSMRKGAA